MAGRCKRTSTIRSYTVPAGGTVDVVLGTDTTEYTLRVVDALGVGVAWTLAYVASPSVLFHFTAAEGWQEERIGPMAAPLTLRIGCAVAAVGELVVWEG